MANAEIDTDYAKVKKEKNMANDNETVEQACEEFKTPKYTCKNCDFKICPSINMFSDRVLTAHKREIADEKRISDAVIQSLRDKKLEMAGEIAAKEAEVSTLRALVGEMADELSKFHAWEEARALVAKAREAIGGTK